MMPGCDCARRSAASSECNCSLHSAVRVVLSMTLTATSWPLRPRASYTLANPPVPSMVSATSYVSCCTVIRISGTQTARRSRRAVRLVGTPLAQLWRAGRRPLSKVRTIGFRARLEARIQHIWGRPSILGAHRLRSGASSAA
eukprot:5263659-Prymnesium_polylepis.1